MAGTKKFATVDEYVMTLPREVQGIVEELRAAILGLSPEIREAISYDMPAYFYKDYLVYFGAFKKHIGFFPASEAVFERFETQLSPYKQSGKGTVQFPYAKTVPVALVAEIVRFRMTQQDNEAAARS